MTDKELLISAAKAAGIELDWDIPENSRNPWSMTGEGDSRGPASEWNPLTDDGDALRLAGKLHLKIDTGLCLAWNGAVDCIEVEVTDHASSTRRAIVRAAAEIGKEAK